LSIWTDNWYDTVVTTNGKRFRTFGEQYAPDVTADAAYENRIKYGWNNPSGWAGPQNAVSLRALCESPMLGYYGFSGLSFDELFKTIKAYNAMVRANQGDTQFLKEQRWLAEIQVDEGSADGDAILVTNPGYNSGNPTNATNWQTRGRIHFEFNSIIYMGITGGLRTDEHMQICDESDNPIPGLFNVGVMVGDVWANIYNFSIPGHCYGGNCLTFSKVLGQDLANNAIPGNA
jgi:hypothetical protein